MISPPDRTDGFGLYFPVEPVEVESGEYTFTFFSIELVAEVANFTKIEHSSFGDIRTFIGGDESIKIGEFQLSLEE